ncbi:hypothetical protein HMPREF3191_00136, partial [Veillonellaceae bacterium DNF00626]
IGGDIRIGKFKEGSVITVSTSNENIDNYEDEITRALKKKIHKKGDLKVETKVSEGLLTAPRNFFTLFIDRSALQEDSTEDPNIPDFKLNVNDTYGAINDPGFIDAMVDDSEILWITKVNPQENPGLKDFTTRIRDGKHDCDEDEECTPYVLMGEESGNKIYGGVGIMAKKKDVVIDMNSNNCEIEVLPHPMNQNIFGILAKNNKTVHMAVSNPSRRMLDTDEEYEFYLKNKNKITLSLDNSQDDSGNVYGICAESGKIRIDSDVEIIKAATKNKGYGTFDAISTVGKNSKIYLTAKFTMLGTAITGNVDKTKNARTAVTLAGDNSLIHIHSADIDNRNGGQL